MIYAKSMDHQPTNSADDKLRSSMAELNHSKPGIIHVMLWTFGTAVAFGLYRHQYTGDRLPADISWIVQISVFIYGLYGGIAIGSLPLFIYRLQTNRGPAMQPGHWLLLKQSLHMLAYGIVFLLFASIEAITLLHLAECAIATWLIFMNRERRWRVVFGISAVSNASGAILLSLGGFYIEQIASWLFTFGFAAAVVYATLRDKRLGIGRDWLHRIGIATVFIGIIHTVVIRIIYMFVM